MARNPHASYEASDHQRMPIIPKFTDYIANNLTTTVAGFALDARQGKVLNDKIENIPGFAWKSLINQTNQITKSALVSLPLGVHILQVATAPSDFPISNAYGILLHAGSLVNYHWLVFFNATNMFVINCSGTSIGDWHTYTPMGLINNLTTTVAGYALDARQGKALDDKITSLNNSLAKSGQITYSTATFYFLQCSKILVCTVICSAQTTFVQNTWTDLGTMPTGLNTNFGFLSIPTVNGPIITLRYHSGLVQYLCTSGNAIWAQGSGATRFS